MPELMTFEITLRFQAENEHEAEAIAGVLETCSDLPPWMPEIERVSFRNLTPPEPKAGNNQ